MGEMKDIGPQVVSFGAGRMLKVRVIDAGVGLLLIYRIRNIIPISGGEGCYIEVEGGGNSSPFSFGPPPITRHKVAHDSHEVIAAIESAMPKQEALK